MKIKVKMKWVEASNEWHMMLPNGSFVYNFFDCDNVRRIFDMPSKESDESFLINIHREL